MGGSTKPGLMPRRPVTTPRPQTGVVGFNNIAPKMQAPPALPSRLPQPKPSLPKMQLGLTQPMQQPMMQQPMMQPPMGIRSPGVPSQLDEQFRYNQDIPQQTMGPDLSTVDFQKLLDAGIIKIRGPGGPDVDDNMSMFNPNMMPRTY